MPTTDNGYAVAYEVLGSPGVMLSGVKQPPRGCEDHTIYWNACIFQKCSRKDAFQIWYGDLDLTASEAELQRIADTLQETIYVTPEQPWRFNGFKDTMRIAEYAERAVRFDPC